MAFKGLTDSLHKVTDRIEDYSLSMAEYYKLRLFKSVMKGSISLVNLLVYGSLFLFVLLFLSLGAAFWLATFFENVYAGFLLIGAFYGIILIFMFIFCFIICQIKYLGQNSKRQNHTNKQSANNHNGQRLLNFRSHTRR